MKPVNNPNERRQTVKGVKQAEPAGRGARKERNPTIF